MVNPLGGNDMKKLLAAIVAGMFLLSTVPAVLAAKHEMKKDEKKMKTEKKAKTEAKKKKDEKKTEKKAKTEAKKKKDAMK
jgi:hypothetical protein